MGDNIVSEHALKDIGICFFLSLMYEYFDFIPYHIKNKSKRHLSVAKTVEYVKFSKPRVLTLNTYLDYQLVAKSLQK